MFETRKLEAADSDSKEASAALPRTSPDGTDRGGRFGRLYGASLAMRDIYAQIARVAPSDASVLIVGENGSGKELVAQTIHEMSAYADQPFLAVNCGALPSSLVEAELFGYEKGAFTGAHRAHAGYFERAHGGTLFLDEIGEMAPEMQVRLLRVLETRCVQRIGSDQEMACAVRIIAATNRDPMQAIQDMQLREDLYYRLAEFPILLPPLRERGDDVCLLARHFLREANQRHGRSKRFVAGVEGKLRTHDWPGNVRELKNCIQRAYVMAETEVDIDTGGPFKTAEPVRDEGLVFAPGMSLAEVERRFILATLEHFHGDKRRAAVALGVSLKTVYNKLNHYLAHGQTARAEDGSDP
ncbi:MAG TPA: sigma-54 dependent transcriptional regulator [Rhodocyclaceae bacterium]|nr:sigma-54 dependent transcriptional regulator [Rhodocyclaceae bacterium]